MLTDFGGLRRVLLVKGNTCAHRGTLHLDPKSMDDVTKAAFWAQSERRFAN